MNSATPMVQSLREDVALAHRVLYYSGLDTEMGHVSARIPGTDRMVIRALPNILLVRLKAEDIVVMNLEGEIVEGKRAGITQVSEWPIHAEIYRTHPDVGTVIHTHQRWATMMGIAGRTLLPIDDHAASVVADPLPVFDWDRGSIRTVQQGRRVAEVLGNAVGCHLQNHGMVFVGRNIPYAISVALQVEQAAEVNWKAVLVGTPTVLPMIFLRPGVESRQTGEMRAEGWNYWKWVDQHPESVRFRIIQ